MKAKMPEGWTLVTDAVSGKVRFSYRWDISFGVDDLRALLATQDLHTISNPKTFEQAWAEKETEGYQYGEDALEQVKFGWELAMAELKRS